MLELSQANSDTTNKLRNVLTNFAVPNNSTLLQASKDLHELSQNSSFFSSLFYILLNDDTPQIRQTAAIVFRRKTIRMWKSFEANIQSEVKQAVLHGLVKEHEKFVQHSIMEIIGSIAKQELSAERKWLELMAFIPQAIQSADAKEKENGCELLKIVCASCAEHFEGQYEALLVMIDEALKSNLSTTSSYFCVEAFNSLIPYLGDDQARYVRPLVPKCVQVIRMLLDNNCESQASDLIELFESLIETEVSFIATYVKDLVLFVLQIASDSNVDEDIRARVLSVLQCIIRSKKKAVLKNKLIGPILDVICPIIVSPIDESSENDEVGFIGDSTDVQSPLACSLHVIDDMALHFPPAQLYKKLMPFVEGCIASSENRCKRGMLLTLACLSEGTSEYIKSKHMRSFLEVVCRGAIDSHPRVRNAALFALGQFSEHLQPDINNYASEIMPLLFNVLHQMQDEKRGSGLTKAYYALENFVENLESDIHPYLSKLMDHLLTTLRSTSSIHRKELVISSIGAVSNSAKESLLPYLPDILEQIQTCLSTLAVKDEDGELCLLHTQALDTLSVLVRNLGKLNLQLAEDSMKLGMQLLEVEDADPDLRRAAFGLFGAVAFVVGEGMQPFLNRIVQCMINSIQSTDGIIAHYNGKASESCDFSFLDDSLTDADNCEDENENEAVDGFSVENSYMDEKVDALDALGDFAKHCGRSFEPYLNLCLEEVVQLQDFPHADVRKAAATSFGHFIIACYNLQHQPSKGVMVSVFPVLSSLIMKDSERLVVMAAITSAKEIIDSCGLEALANQEKDLAVLMQAIVSVLQQKSACQDDDTIDEDDQQAEYDEMLIEYCGEILPILAEKLKSNFLPYFVVCLPSLISKLRPSSTTSEKSFAAGTIAEAVEKLGPCCPSEILKNVVPRFIQLSRDGEVEVRNNSIYGLGILLQNGGHAAAQHYPLVLSCLSQALAKEKSRRVIDNILSSLARMISCNKQLLPLKQILPIFLANLPIQEDHDEDAAVYGCLATLLRDQEVAYDVTYVAKIADIFAKVLTDDDVSKELRISLEEELRSLKSRTHPSFSEILNSSDLTPTSRDLMQRLWAT